MRLFIPLPENAGRPISKSNPIKTANQTLTVLMFCLLSFCICNFDAMMMYVNGTVSVNIIHLYLRLCKCSICLLLYLYNSILARFFALVYLRRSDKTVSVSCTILKSLTAHVSSTV